MGHIDRIYDEVGKLYDSAMNNSRGYNRNYWHGMLAAYDLVFAVIASVRREPTPSVWHDANTLPSDPKAVIVEHNEYSTSICRAEQMSRVKSAKWAYIEDLLKL